ncbi:TspO/MBR-related protein [Thelephora terrestris]|uniref:TspO/MBR-related protein n=1 Tax=Thelephora terrestris TaxID=56493 RepID=A0A9P6L2T3_9AGAM|nr:TspO/MBR-related protein [Thelephora terrestris]
MSPSLPGFLFEVPRNPVFAVGLPIALGFLSGARTKKVIDGTWYQSLSFPPGRPPRLAFPIVWTALYTSMGYASYLAVSRYDRAILPITKETIHTGLKWYYVQLGLNFLWSPIFFNAKSPLAAFVDAVALTGSTCYMTKLFHDATDGATTPLLVPYCAWLSFVIYINGSIWWLNRGRNLPKYD